MAFGNEIKYADLADLTKRYGMSLVQAAAVEVPCGIRKGGLIGNEGGKSLYWFATRRVSTKTSKPMRDAICAARILRAANHAQAQTEKAAAVIANAGGTDLTSSKRALMECISCGTKSLIWRAALDRRGRIKCLLCGGTLNEFDSAPIDEYLTLREVADEYGLTKHVVLKAIERGDVVSRKRGNRVVVGRASIENTFRQP